MTGDFGSTYSLLVLTVYLNDLIYLGIPYFVVLLFYSYVTRRKASRADMVKRAAGPTPSDSGGGSGPSPRPTDSPDSNCRSGRRPPRGDPN